MFLPLFNNQQGASTSTASLQRLRFALPGLILLGLTVFVPRTRAETRQWVITREWEGRGPMTTPMFKVNGSKWRLIYRHSSNTVFHVDIFDENHNKIKTASSSNAPFYSFITLKERGVYYLKIRGTEAPWDVKVKQLVTSLEEWDLLQSLRKRRKKLEPLASRYGDAGEETLPVTVPQGSWQIKYAADNEDGEMTLRVKLKQPDGGKKAFKPQKCTLSGRGQASTWVHFPGEFKLEIEAEDTPWKVDLFYYPPKDLSSGDKEEDSKE
ncbi:MAG: hypothetical protein R6V56_00460 [Lentisphaeria bacterium]